MRCTTTTSRSQCSQVTTTHNKPGLSFVCESSALPPAEAAPCQSHHANGCRASATCSVIVQLYIIAQTRQQLMRAALCVSPLGMKLHPLSPLFLPTFGHRRHNTLHVYELYRKALLDTARSYCVGTEWSKQDCSVLVVHQPASTYALYMRALHVSLVRQLAPACGQSRHRGTSPPLPHESQNTRRQRMPRRLSE